MICGKAVRGNEDRLATLARQADSREASDQERADREVAFHMALVELAECPALSSEYGRVMRIGLFYRVNLLMTVPAREPASRHLDLLQQLCDASPPEAEEAVRGHIWAGKPDTLRA
jgi:DNA-binding GntR family transcriptional regulator